MFVCYYVWLWINACMSYFVVCCVCQGDRGFVSVHYPNVSVFYKLVAYEQSCLYAQCPGGYLATCVLLLRCVCHSLWGLLRVCAHLGDWVCAQLQGCVFAHVKILRTKRGWAQCPSRHYVALLWSRPSSRSRSADGAPPLGGGELARDLGWVEVWAGTQATYSTLHRFRLVCLEAVYTVIRTG